MILHELRKKVREGKTWCGPGALTIITGCSYEEAEDAIRNRRWRRTRRQDGRLHQIVGTGLGEMQAALGDLGFTSEWRRLERDYGLERGRATLGQWLRARGDDYGEVCLVSITGHWIVVQAGDVADNSRAEAAEASRHLRCRVRSVTVVRPRAEMRTPKKEEARVRVTTSAKVLDVLGLGNGEVESTWPAGDLAVLRRTKHEVTWEGSPEALGKLDAMLGEVRVADGAHCSWVWSAERARVRIAEALGGRP